MHCFWLAERAVTFKRVLREQSDKLHNLIGASYMHGVQSDLRGYCICPNFLLSPMEIRSERKAESRADIIILVARAWTSFGMASQAQTRSSRSADRIVLDTPRLSLLSRHHGAIHFLEHIGAL